MFAMIVGYSFMLGPAEQPKMVCKNGVCQVQSQAKGPKILKSKGLLKRVLGR